MAYYFLFTEYRMSVLNNATTANGKDYYFALSGGGAASSLQSPASVTPVAGTGSCSLSLVNAAGGGDSVVNIQDTTGNLAILNMANAVGGDSIISMGVLGGSKVNLVAPSSNQGQVQVQANATGTPYLTVDTVNNAVTIASSVSSGIVDIHGGIIIDDFATGPNGLGLTTTSITGSRICQTIASGGIVAIGSSLAQQNTLIVTETAGNGYVEVLGRGSANGVFLAGGVNQALVTTNTASGGQMSIGCSISGNYDAILITDVPQAQTIIKNQLPPAISNGNNVYFAGPFATGGNTIPAPVGLVAGVYLMMVNGVTSSYFAQGATIAYWTGSVWGSGAAIVSANNGTGVLQIQPDPTTAGALFYNNSSGAPLAATLILIPLFVGNIPSLA